MSFPQRWDLITTIMCLYWQLCSVGCVVFCGSLGGWLPVRLLLDNVALWLRFELGVLLTCLVAATNCWQKQLKSKMVHLGSQFLRMQSIMVEGISARAVPGYLAPTVRRRRTDRKWDWCMKCVHVTGHILATSTERKTKEAVYLYAFPEASVSRPQGYYAPSLGYCLT